MRLPKNNLRDRVACGRGRVGLFMRRSLRSQRHVPHERKRHDDGARHAACKVSLRLVLLIVVLSGLPSFGNAARTVLVTLGSEHPIVTALAIDPSGTFAYAATTSQDFRYSVPKLSGKLLRLRLSDFVFAGSLKLALGENAVTSIVVDPAGHNAYLGTYGDPHTGAPAKVIRIHLPSFTRKNAAALDKETFGLSTGVLNRSGSAVYWGTLFGTVCGTSLPALTSLGSASLDKPSTAIGAAVIDASGRYGYFATSSGGLLQIDVNQWLPSASLSLLGNEPGFTSGTIDKRGEASYWLTAGNPARVIRVQLQDLKSGPTKTLGQAEKEGVALFLDETAQLAYAVVQGPPVGVVRMHVPSLERVDFKALPASFGKVTAAAYDARRRKLYAAMGKRPARIVQIDMTIPVPKSSGHTFPETSGACGPVEGCNESLQSLP